MTNSHNIDLAYLINDAHLRCARAFGRCNNVPFEAVRYLDNDGAWAIVGNFTPGEKTAITRNLRKFATYAVLTREVVARAV